MAFAMDPKLSKLGVVPPALEALTKLIPTTGKGITYATNSKWNDFLYMAQLRYPELTKDQITYVVTGMRLRTAHSQHDHNIIPKEVDFDAYLSHAPNKLDISDDVRNPLDDPSSNVAVKISSAAVPDPKKILDEPP